MILSHRYRFIFLKTGKTAGTSIEIALSEYCGAKDIITPIKPEDELTRRSLGFRGPQNYLDPDVAGAASATGQPWAGTPNRKFYERLETDLEEFRVRVGLPQPLSLPHAKASFRTDHRHFREILSPEELRRSREYLHRKSPSLATNASSEAPDQEIRTGIRRRSGD